MKSYLRQLILVTVLLLSPLLAFAQASPEFSKIIFFGDSLSDNGNLYSDDFGFMPKSPPYFKGRFSSGPVWSEYVDQKYQENGVETVNYAIGGQTAIFHNPVKGYQPYTLSVSLNNYLLRTAFRDRTNTLFIIWVGANDYLPGIDNLDELSTNVVASIKYAVDKLISHGAVNFLVINLPDMAKAPYGETPAQMALLHAASLVHNLKLDAAVTQVQAENKNVNIQLFNVYQLFDDFLRNPQQYNDQYQTHVSIFDQSCWKGGYTLKARNPITEEMIKQQIEAQMQTQSKSLTASTNNGLYEPMDADGLARYIATNPALMETFKVSNPQLSGEVPCSNPDDYMFWDHIHPTAPMHYIVGQSAIQFIDQNFQAKRIK